MFLNLRKIKTGFKVNLILFVLESSYDYEQSELSPLHMHRVMFKGLLKEDNIRDRYLFFIFFPVKIVINSVRNVTNESLRNTFRYIPFSVWRMTINFKNLSLNIIIDKLFVKLDSGRVPEAPWYIKS